jgi:predicted helicase
VEGAELFAFTLRGLKSGRDAWVYNVSRPAVRSNMTRMLAFYNAEVDRSVGVLRQRCYQNQLDWGCPKRSGANRKYDFDPDALFVGMYRPFAKQVLLRLSSLP